MSTRAKRQQRRDAYGRAHKTLTSARVARSLSNNKTSGDPRNVPLYVSHPRDLGGLGRAFLEKIRSAAMAGGLRGKRTEKVHRS